MNTPSADELLQWTCAIGRQAATELRSRAVESLHPWEAEDDARIGATLVPVFEALGFQLDLAPTGVVVAVVPKDSILHQTVTLLLHALVLTTLSELQAPLHAALAPQRCAVCGRAIVPLPGMACDACHLEA